MAKSLRSKSKRAFRKIKREDPSSAYNKIENLRMSRLSAGLKAAGLKPKALTDAEEYKRSQEGYVTEEEDEASMVVEEPVVEDVIGEDGEKIVVEKEKISTSGPRFTRRESYRSDKKFQIRLTRKTEFRAKGEKKTMGCKPHRRR